jgi:transposase
MNGQMYRDSVLRDIVVTHFDNHPLASRPLNMDNNARPHRARIVNQYKQQEAIDTIPWPAMSPDMNPIEHVWDYIGQRLNHRNPQCQNLAELRTSMVKEWQNFPQYKLRRLVHSMKQRVRELFRKRGGLTH